MKRLKYIALFLLLAAFTLPPCAAWAQQGVTTLPVSTADELAQAVSTINATVQSQTGDRFVISLQNDIAIDHSLSFTRHHTTILGNGHTLRADSLTAQGKNVSLTLSAETGGDLLYLDPMTYLFALPNTALIKTAGVANGFLANDLTHMQYALNWINTAAEGTFRITLAADIGYENANSMSPLPLLFLKNSTTILGNGHTIYLPLQISGEGTVLSLGDPAFDGKRENELTIRSRGYRTDSLIVCDRNAALNLYNGVGLYDNFYIGGDGGAALQVRGTVRMYGGEIKNNHSYSTGLGGGVALYSGVFDMYGGSISDNEAFGAFLRPNDPLDGVGGGVILCPASGDSAVMNLYGGSISGNSANGMHDPKGGGIALMPASGGTAALTLYGGKIVNNRAFGAAGGVYLPSGGSALRLAPTAQSPVTIANNTGHDARRNTVPANLWIGSDMTVAVAGDMRASRVGVTEQTPALPFTHGYARSNPTLHPSRCFFSDDPAWQAVYDKHGEVKLGFEDEERLPTPSPIPTATPEPSDTAAPSTPPRTGDTGHAALWALLMGLSLCGLAALSKRRLQ